MAALSDLLDKYKQAVYNKDVESFASIFDDNIQVFDLWDWSFQGLAAWRKMAEGWFEWLGSEKVKVDFMDVQVQEMGSMGYVSAAIKYTGLSADDEPLRSLVERLTWVAVQKNGEWKVVHGHASGPVDRETMKVILEHPKKAL